MVALVMGLMMVVAGFGGVDQVEHAWFDGQMSMGSYDHATITVSGSQGVLWISDDLDPTDTYCEDVIQQRDVINANEPFTVTCKLYDDHNQLLPSQPLPVTDLYWPQDFTGGPTHFYCTNDF